MQLLLLELSILFFAVTLVPLAMLHLVSDSLTGEDSLLGCDLLSHTSPHGNQSVSALPSSSSSSTCSSAPPGSGTGSCLEDLPPGQAVSGKTSTLQLTLCLLGVLAYVTTADNRSFLNWQAWLYKDKTYNCNIKFELHAINDSFNRPLTLKAT